MINFDVATFLAIATFDAVSYSMGSHNRDLPIYRNYPLHWLFYDKCSVLKCQ